MPPNKAAPYPRTGTGTNFAPSAAAISREPSVLPLSATRISAEIPLDSMNCLAFRMHVANVSASLRQGMSTVSSMASPWSGLALRMLRVYGCSVLGFGAHRPHEEQDTSGRTNHQDKQHHSGHVAV